MSEFDEDVRKWRELHSGLVGLRAVKDLAFEERLHLLRLRFPLENIRDGNCECGERKERTYCIFVSQYGIYHLPLANSEVEVAEKIKMRAPLSRDDKSAALNLLCKLAIGRVEL